MINGAHAIIYSRDADADRAFFKEVLGLRSVDAGGGWLIFALPPAELAVHPSGTSSHELYLMCDDLDAFLERMSGLGVPCGEPRTERCGTITQVTLPGGGTLGVYQPTHPSPATPV